MSPFADLERDRRAIWLEPKVAVEVGEGWRLTR
jgi:hypothetical protein